VILTFSKKTVTGDESWRFAYDPVMKQQSCVNCKKFAAATETLIPEVSSEEHVGDI
jgi:hypothetical protein